jgi:hypothetical protein
MVSYTLDEYIHVPMGESFEMDTFKYLAKFQIISSAAEFYRARDMTTLQDEDDFKYYAYKELFEKADKKLRAKRQIAWAKERIKEHKNQSPYKEYYNRKIKDYSKDLK